MSLSRFPPLVIVLASFFGVGLTLAQSRIDSTMAFSSDPAKKYAIVVPSSYEEGVPNKAIIAFHPLNQAWGSSRVWCDILTPFAEANDALMFCPDGGPDLRVDDPIDLAFASALIDSMKTGYSVAPNELYALGFSWGARATFIFGLDNLDLFAGFLTLGAFINNLNPVGATRIARATGKPFYLLHGDRDTRVDLNTGFFPIRSALEAAGAVVNSRILEGVGHTINFANRDSILTEAFVWLEDTAAGLSVDTDLDPTLPVNVALQAPYPNPFSTTSRINFEVSVASSVRIEVFDLLSRQITILANQSYSPGTHHADWDGKDDAGFDVPGGTYFIRLTIADAPAMTQTVVRIK